MRLTTYGWKKHILWSCDILIFFSYFCNKTYTVGTHRGDSSKNPQYVFHGKILCVFMEKYYVFSWKNIFLNSGHSVCILRNPASILRTSTSGRHRPVSYPDGLMTARYRFT